MRTKTGPNGWSAWAQLNFRAVSSRRDCRETVQQLVEGFHGSWEEAAVWRYRAPSGVQRVTDLKREAHDLKEVASEQALKRCLRKKSMLGLLGDANIT